MWILSKGARISGPSPGGMTWGVDRLQADWICSAGDMQTRAYEYEESSSLWSTTVPYFTTMSSFPFFWSADVTSTKR